jgi:hypothetical protein
MELRISPQDVYLHVEAIMSENKLDQLYENGENTAELCKELIFRIIRHNCSTIYQGLGILDAVKRDLNDFYKPRMDKFLEEFNNTPGRNKKNGAVKYV